MLKSILFFIFSVYGLIVYPQANLETIVKNHSSRLKQKLIDQISLQKTFVQHEGQSIKAFPGFNLELDSIKNTLSEDNIRLDPDLNFYIISQDSAKYYLDNYSLEHSSQLAIKPQLKISSPYKEAIDFAEKHSNSVFFLYTWNIPVVAYFEKSQLKLIDVDMRTYDSLADFLSYRYGSVENFKEHIKRNRYEANCLNGIKTLEDARLIILNYWFSYSYYNVYNIPMLANAVVNVVKQSSKLTEFQENILKANLLSQMDQEGFMKKLHGNLVGYDEHVKRIFFESKIKIILKNTLLNDQYRNFLSNEEFCSNMFYKANDFVHNYYREKTKLEGWDEIEKVIKKEMFESE